MSLDPAWIALVATVTGGVGLKVAEHWLGRNKVKIDDATQIRDELRTEVTRLRAELTEQERAVDQWRTDYYDLKETYMQLQSKVTLMEARVKDQ